MADYVLIALLMGISDEGGASVDALDQSRCEQYRGRHRRLLSGR